MIHFKNVSKIYPSGVAALDGVNLSIESGEFVFLVGSSGAGKTTLLRLLIGEIKPTGGTVLLDQWEVPKVTSRQLPFLRRLVGFVFQDFKLLDDLTAGENIAVALEILGKSKKEISRRIDEVLDIIHLSKKKHFFPKQLSFGEQQRIAIGRAIAGEARILLTDEPTGNLDPETSWEVLHILQDIQKKGTTILMATHNVDIVNSLKKRVVVLANGKIVRDEKKSRYT